MSMENHFLGYKHFGQVLQAMAFPPIAGWYVPYPSQPSIQSFSRLRGGLIFAQACSY